MNNGQWNNRENNLGNIPNNSYPNGNSFPNNYNNGYQYGNNNQWNYPNNYYRNPNMGKEIIRTSKNISIAYIFFFLIEIACAIVAGIFLVKIISIAYQNTYDYSDANAVQIAILNNFEIFFCVIAIDIILGIVLLVLGIVLVVKTNSLKQYYPQYDNLWIIFLVGIFIAIPSFVASIMTIVAYKKINKLQVTTTNNQSFPQRY